MKINFNHIDFKFENMGGNKPRIEKISHLIIDILEEKLQRDGLKHLLITTKHDDALNIDKIIIPSITVDPGKTDYQIATTCASAVYLDFIKKLE